MSKEPVFTFRNPDRIPFALAVLDCWLGNDDRKMRTEAILAEAFGHSSYSALVNASTEWVPASEAATPEHQAWMLSSIVSRPEKECARILGLMNADNRPIDEEGVLKKLEARFADRPWKAKAVAFFRTHRYLLVDADFALRLREAGKNDLGIEAALEGRHLDVLDVFENATGDDFLPAAALAVYYEVPANMTVWSDSIFKPREGVRNLLEFGDDFRNMVSLLKATAGYPADGSLDFRSFQELLREDPELPIPTTHDEIRAAASVHRSLRDFSEEFFGIITSRHLLPIEEWPGSWELLEKLVDNLVVNSAVVEEARERIEDFVRSRNADPEQWVSIRFDEWNALLLGRESRRIAGFDDASLVRYLKDDRGRLWKDDEDEDSILEAVSSFEQGGKPRKSSPSREEVGAAWQDNPDIQAATEDMMNFARGRK